MADGDFSSRDRPDEPRLPEGRLRGGGPEDSRQRGTWPVWLVFILLLAAFVILTVLLG
jgi:hypothetical protein